MDLSTIISVLAIVFALLSLWLAAINNQTLDEMERKEWLKKCAARFIERVPDMRQFDANNCAEICLDDMCNGDVNEMTPDEAADEELSNWTD